MVAEYRWGRYRWGRYRWGRLVGQLAWLGQQGPAGGMRVGCRVPGAGARAGVAAATVGSCARRLVIVGGEEVGRCALPASWQGTTAGCPLVVWPRRALPNHAPPTPAAASRGVLVRASVAEARERRYRQQGRDCYLFNLDDQHVLDATRAGAISKFTVCRAQGQGVGRAGPAGSWELDAHAAAGRPSCGQAGLFPLLLAPTLARASFAPPLPPLPPTSFLPCPPCPPPSEPLLQPLHVQQDTQHRRPPAPRLLRAPRHRGGAGADVQLQVGGEPAGALRGAGGGMGPCWVLGAVLRVLCCAVCAVLCGSGWAGAEGASCRALQV